MVQDKRAQVGAKVLSLLGKVSTFRGSVSLWCTMVALMALDEKLDSNGWSFWKKIVDC